MVRAGFSQAGADTRNRRWPHDKRRAAVIRKFYQQEWCSRGLYHMLLNSAMGMDAMIAAVQAAAGLEITAPVAVGPRIDLTGSPC